MANLTTYKQNDKDYLITFTDDNGDAIDITGSTVYFTVKNSYSDADASALITKTVTSHTNPTGGITTVSLDTTDTDITPGGYLYDINRKDSTGKISTIALGGFTVLDIVRDNF